MAYSASSSYCTVSDGVKKHVFAVVEGETRKERAAIKKLMKQ
jgi:hypothetical protein